MNIRCPEGSASSAISQKKRSVLLTVLLAISTPGVWAQQAAQTTTTTTTTTTSTPSTSDVEKPQDETIVLSPFEVSSSETKGYAAATTLAGNRLNTETRDIGNAVTVITSQFLKDVGATDNASLLQYTTNSEVGSVYGNFVGSGNGATLDESAHFVNPNANTRIRGLAAADNTRDYFTTDVPWDSFDVDGVDLQRGPNSILFGQGSPAGIINTRLKQAAFKDSNELQLRYGSYGSARGSLDIDRVIIPDELAFRIIGLRDEEKYEQKPAHNLDSRLYGAMRWEPHFLKIDGARTIFKADIEYGQIKSNNPRTLPPIDEITPWFYTGTTAGTNVAGQPFNFPNLNKLSTTPFNWIDGNTGLPNHGYSIKTNSGPGISGTPNIYYEPWGQGSLGGEFGNPAFNFNNTNGTSGLTSVMNWEPQSANGAILPTGPNPTVDLHDTVVGSVLQFERPGSVAPYSVFATNAGLPNSTLGVYKDKSLTDASVFDFYHKLLDGPNKAEWQNWRVFNLSLDQTFFHDQLGFEATYNNETYDSGQWTILNGEGQSIGLDFNTNYPDNDVPDVTGGMNGTPNPNFGKAFIGGNGVYGNNEHFSQRESGRLTVFAEHDFGAGDHPSILGKLVGRHIITGLLSKDNQKTDDRSYSLYSTDQAYEAFVNNSADGPGKDTFINNVTVPFTYVYLGNSLAAMSSASGANLPNPSAFVGIPDGTYQERTWDGVWNAKGVDPSSFYHLGYYPNPTLNVATGAPTTAGNQTQNTNPANYVGFVNVPMKVISSFDSPANLNANTHDAALGKSEVTSHAFTWQAHFWDNFLVATYGVRRDVATAWSFAESTTSATSDAYGRLDLDPSVYKLPSTPINTITATSHAWTAVAHLNQLPFLNKLPFQISVFYNKSSDFQPAAQRVDVYGVPLGPPKGVTDDKGILLESQDGRYSLKLNKYKTTATDASLPGIGGAWFIGASQAWAANWVNRFQYKWTSDTITGAVAVNDPNNSEYNYQPAPGESLADSQTRMNSVIAAWRAWQASVDPRFYQAWGINLNDHTKSVGSTNPQGFTITEDSVSKGYEIEFSALPTKNWRLTFNASKADATESNVGGANLISFVNAYEKVLSTGKGGVGDLRIWWGTAGNETSLQDWNNNVGSQLAQVFLNEGSSAPELRKWRYNAITNYDFDHGILKGVNVGGGVRYESSLVAGYPVLPSSTTSPVFDIAHPYRGPSDTNFDLWIGYRRNITRKLAWDIQLNVYNVGVGNKLEVVTVEPDGSPATLRIRPPQRFELNNTFTF